MTGVGNTSGWDSLGIRLDLSLKVYKLKGKRQRPESINSQGEFYFFLAAAIIPDPVSLCHNGNIRLPPPLD